MKIQSQITAVILAGGEGQRMGGQDKGLLLWNNRPLVQYCVDALRPQVQQVIISANRHQAHYAALTQCQVISDEMPYAGPLAGIAQGLAAATTPYVLFVPCDAPIIAPNLAQVLWDALHTQERDLSVASDGQQLHCVFALIKRELHNKAIDSVRQGNLKLHRWLLEQHAAIADCSTIAETFINLNTPQDWENASYLLHL